MHKTFKKIHKLPILPTQNTWRVRFVKLKRVVYARVFELFWH